MFGAVPRVSLPFAAVWCVQSHKIACDIKFRFGAVRSGSVRFCIVRFGLKSFQISVRKRIITEREQLFPGHKLRPCVLQFKEGVVIVLQIESSN
jgi:hypothetical protein